MKLAIYHNLPSGGGKRALLEMVRRLAGHHCVDCYTLSCAEHDFCDIRPHVNKHVVFPFTTLPEARHPFGHLNQGFRTADLLRLRALQSRIAAEIDAGGYDLVFAHVCRYGQSPAVLAALRTASAYYCAEPPRLIYEPLIPRPHPRKGVVQSLSRQIASRVDPLPWLYRTLLGKLDRSNVLAASLVLTNSAFSRESLYRTYGIFARVCYLGVDLERFQPLALDKEPMVLSVGAITPHKGFDFLIRSLSHVDAQTRPSLVLVSNAANSPERIFIEELAQRSEVILSIKTLITDDELAALYSRAQLVLYAPVMEPFGFVPLEAMACGTPVVAVREGGVRESVRHDETGLLTERDSYEFAQATQYLLTNAAARCQFGVRGRRYVEQSWTWDRCLQNLEQNLERAARSGHDGLQGTSSD